MVEYLEGLNVTFTIDKETDLEKLKRLLIKCDVIENDNELPKVKNGTMVVFFRGFFYDEHSINFILNFGCRCKTEIKRLRKVKYCLEEVVDEWN